MTTTHSKCAETDTSRPVGVVGRDWLSQVDTRSYTHGRLQHVNKHWKIRPAPNSMLESLPISLCVLMIVNGTAGFWIDLLHHECPRRTCHPDHSHRVEYAILAMYGLQVQVSKVDQVMTMVDLLHPSPLRCQTAHENPAFPSAQSGGPPLWQGVPEAPDSNMNIC